MHITYTFIFDDGTTERFDLVFMQETLQAAWPLPDELPEWCRLEYRKCPHCPFAPQEVRDCPLVARLVDVVMRLGHLVSYDEMLVEVETPERTVSQRTTAQRGVSSMLGLIIPTSGCPHTAFFRPMARFHLPFSSPDETFYRAASMYMLAQYFRAASPEEVDLNMEGLGRIYRNMEIVNLQLVERLRGASSSDSSVNAVVILDLFAKSMPVVLDERLDDFRYLFNPYLSLDTSEK